MPSAALHTVDPQQMSSLNLLFPEKGLMERGSSTLPLLQSIDIIITLVRAWSQP